MRGGAGQSSERPSVRAVSSTKDVTQRLDSVSRSKAAREREPAKVIAWRVRSVECVVENHRAHCCLQ